MSNNNIYMQVQDNSGGTIFKSMPIYKVRLRVWEKDARDIWVSIDEQDHMNIGNYETAMLHYRKMHKAWKTYTKHGNRKGYVEAFEAFMYSDGTISAIPSVSYIERETTNGEQANN